MLWARNKWLLAHPDTSEAKNGAYVGISGDNIDVEAEMRDKMEKLGQNN